MHHEQPPEKPVHPLERGEARVPPPAGDTPPPRQQVTLHIPSVRPLVTYAILITIGAVFVVRALSPQVDYDLFLWGANNGRSVLLEGEFYRLFTSMFLHASIYDIRGGFALQNSLHIIFNAYIIYAAGSAVERLFGHARYAAIFFLGGLGGSVLSAVLSQNSYSVGASGAAFAVLGAEFVYLYKHRRLLGARGRAQMQGLISLALINLVFGLLSSVSTGPIRVDNWAHLGGALGGLGLAWFISPLYIPRRHPDQPNDLIADDINPFKDKYWAVSLYSIILLVVLIVARVMVS